MHDLLIIGEIVVDATAAPPVAADVAFGRRPISVVGRVEARASEVIDATGLLVTLGCS